MTSLALRQAEELTLDSRKVAKMVEKNHSDLLRDIRTYVYYLTNAEMLSLDFFTQSTYLDTKGESKIIDLLKQEGRI